MWVTQYKNGYSLPLYTLSIRVVRLKKIKHSKKKKIPHLVFCYQIQNMRIGLKRPKRICTLRHRLKCQGSLFRGRWVKELNLLWKVTWAYTLLLYRKNKTSFTMWFGNNSVKTLRLHQWPKHEECSNNKQGCLWVLI